MVSTGALQLLKPTKTELTSIFELATPTGDMQAIREPPDESCRGWLRYRAEQYARIPDPITQNDIPTASYNPAVRRLVLESRFVLRDPKILGISPLGPCTSLYKIYLGVPGLLAYPWVA